MEDYENLQEWDFILSRTGSKLTTVYTLRPAPRKTTTNKVVEAAWSEACAAGFDISRLLVGEDPFKP